MESAHKTAGLIAHLWERNRPLVEERLTLLESAARAATRGTLSEGLRREAAEVAHKLAGSLGMYGFPEGTAVAGELELRLETTPAAELDGTELGELLERLHAALT